MLTMALCTDVTPEQGQKDPGSCSAVCRGCERPGGWSRAWRWKLLRQSPHHLPPLCGSMFVSALRSLLVHICSTQALPVHDHEVGSVHQGLQVPRWSRLAAAMCRLAC